MIRLFILLIIIWALHFWWALFSSIDLNSPVLVTIERGWSVGMIVNELGDMELIKNTFQTKAYITFNGIGGRLQAGEYQFSGAVTVRDVLRSLSKGTGQAREVTLTFIEGWTLSEMADYVSGRKELNISREDFLKAAAESYQYDILESKPAIRDFEGYLFPDTYRVFKNITAEGLVIKMLDNFEEKFTKEFMDALAGQGRTVDEAIILASILERELKTAEEKELGSGVFLKRLAAGIGLQADSTINYITGKKTSRASAKDLKIDSPYNTYKYRGLPPGPISNPGLDSIRASIYPKANDYYYFLTTPDGRAIFSSTLEEHNRQKAHYY